MSRLHAVLFDAEIMLNGKIDWQRRSKGEICEGHFLNAWGTEHDAGRETG